MIGLFILLISGVKGDTRRYRCYHTLEQLHIAGIPCRAANLTDPGLSKLAVQADICILQRLAYDRHVEKIISQMRAAGTAVLSDIDDMTFSEEAIQWIDSPDFQDPVRARLYRDLLKCNRLTLEASDGILTSTNFLAEQLARLARPVSVVRNAFSLEMLARSLEAKQQRKKNNPRLVIGYASGTLTHNKDFASIKPVLLKILRSNPQVDLWLTGALQPGREWSGLENRVRTLKLVPWRQLPSILAQFDINLAPLTAADPFSNSKSEIKYMEAGLVGVPTIATPTRAFRSAIRDGNNGYLAETTQEWLEKLQMLVSDETVRLQMGESAFNDVVAHYHPAVRSGELLQALSHFTGTPGLSVETRREADCDFEALRKELWADDHRERNPTNAQRALYSLRHHGLGTLVGQVWVFFRRLVAPIFPFKGSS